MDGRNHVLPEDVQTVLPFVVSHRLRLTTDTHTMSHTDIAQQLLDIPIP
jgi:MoxR-like ATPase